MPYAKTVEGFNSLGKNVNEVSAIIVLEFAGRKIMLTGDIEDYFPVLLGNSKVLGRDKINIFNLDIVAADIHTIRDNYTRFLRLEYCDRTLSEPMAGEDKGKASLYFNIDNTSGSLYDTLGCFEGLHLNMTKLQSYPIPTEPWHYMFHTDIEFESGANFNKAIERLRERGVEVHIYGIYQKGKDL